MRLSHIALNAPDRRTLKQESAEIHKVTEVVPENVVGPTPLVPGCADIDEALDEEPTGNVPDRLLARTNSGEHVGALVLKPHRMAEPVDLSAQLAGSHHVLRAP